MGMKFGMSLAVGLLASAALIGCGSDDAGDSGSSSGGGLSTSELAEMLEQSGAPADEAQCVAEKLEGDYTREQIQTFIDSVDGSGVDVELVQEIAAALPECVG